MPIGHWRAALSGLAIALGPLNQATAHEIVGNRFFPATIGIDDPGVNDELSLPTVANFKTGDDPSFRQRDFSGEFSKRITEAFAISFGSTFSSFASPGGPTAMGASGFQNLETTFKYRGAAIQYSMPYLKSSVNDLGLPDQRGYRMNSCSP